MEEGRRKHEYCRMKKKECKIFAFAPPKFLKSQRLVKTITKSQITKRASRLMNYEKEWQGRKDITAALFAENSLCL